MKLEELATGQELAKALKVKSPDSAVRIIRTVSPLSPYPVTIYKIHNVNACLRSELSPFAHWYLTEYKPDKDRISPNDPLASFRHHVARKQQLKDSISFIKRNRFP